MSGIVIHRSRHAQNFVVVANSVARDRRLSFRARGLLVMLLSLPPEWHVTTDMLAQDNPDSRTSIRSAMTELRDLGYVVLVTERGTDGRTRRRIEVFDTDETKRGQGAFGATSENVSPDAPRPAFGATSENDASPQVAPNAGKPAVGEPAVGIPAVIYKDGVEEQEEGSLSRAARNMLAAVPGATEREIREVIRHLEQDPAIRNAVAYLKTAVANGDSASLVAEARNRLDRQAQTDDFRWFLKSSRSASQLCGRCGDSSHAASECTR